MSESGVIPRHGPRHIGNMADADGIRITFDLDHSGCVRIGIRVLGDRFRTGVAYLDKPAREEFMRLFMEAERQAEEVTT